MKRRYLNEMLDCLIFGILNGLGNCIGNWAGIYFIEKFKEKRKRRIGF